jgi:hypothetical protein
MAEDLIVANPQILNGKPCVLGSASSSCSSSPQAEPRRNRFWPSILSSNLMASLQRFGTPPMR